MSAWVASPREHDATCSNGHKCMFGNDSPHFPRFTWTGVNYLLALPCMSLRSATQTGGKIWSACSVKQEEFDVPLSFSAETDLCPSEASPPLFGEKFYHFCPCRCKAAVSKGCVKRKSNISNCQINAYLCAALLPLRTVILHLLIRDQKDAEM